MEKQRDYYDVLGVSKTASDSDIKSAFRKLSRQYHPDMQAGKSDDEKKEAEAKFKEIAAAYEILSNKEKRENYDRFGFDGPNGNSSFDMNDFMNSHGSMFSDFFGSHFGFEFGNNNFSKRQNKPNFDVPEDGRNVQIDMEISFKDAIYGCEKEFDIKLTKECSNCHGTGVKSGTTPKQCPACHGTGQYVQRIQRGFMMTQTISECSQCSGSGYVYEKCEHCHGDKRLEDKKHIAIKIPAGIDNGQRLRIVGKGHCGVNGGNDGNLFINISVKQSDLFRRDENNVFTTIYINPLIAALGGKVDVQTPYKKITMKIPSGIVSGKVLRANGEGIKTQNGIGDLYVEVKIDTLVNLTSEQLDMINKLNSTITLNNTLNVMNYGKTVETYNS